MFITLFSYFSTAAEGEGHVIMYSPHNSKFIEYKFSTISNFFDFLLRSNNSFNHNFLADLGHRITGITLHYVMKYTANSFFTNIFNSGHSFFEKKLFSVPNITTIQFMNPSIRDKDPRLKVSNIKGVDCTYMYRNNTQSCQPTHLKLTIIYDL